MRTELEASNWTVILRPDGVVDEVQGGAPFTWVGHLLYVQPEAPEAVRAAAARLTVDDDGHWVRHRRVCTNVGDREVAIDLIVCHAVPLRRTNVVVRDLILRVLDLFRLQAPDCGVEIHLEYADSVPVTFPADGEKITWAISALIGNALRHLLPSEASNVTPRIRIAVDYAFETSELIVRVADNGPGIPADRRRWLFERNPQTGQATGVALVMVRDVVLAHRGTLEVDSQMGRGTTVSLRVPRLKS